MKRKKKTKTKEKRVEINIRCPIGVKKELLKLAKQYSGGNLSRFLIATGLNYNPQWYTGPKVAKTKKPSK